MLNAIIKNNSKEIDVNDFWSLFAAIFMAVIGPAVFIAQPEWVKGLVSNVGFSDREAGFIAGAEMWGMWLTTVIMSFAQSRCNWRRIFAISLVLVAVANVLTLFASSFPAFMTIRFLAGVGSGSIISLSFAVVGLTSKPDRNFGYIMVWVLVYGAIANWIMPVLYGTFHLAGPITLFAILNAAGLPFVRFLPVSGEQAQVNEADTVDLSLRLKILALLSMLGYFVGLGAVWAYVSLIGVADGAGGQQVANGVAISQLFGIAGGLTAVFLGVKIGRTIPLAISILSGVTAASCFLLSPSLLIFSAAVCLFVYGWNVAQPYLLAAMSSFDSSGKTVVYSVALMMTGLAVGPWVGAAMVKDANYTMVSVVGIAMFSSSLILILPPVLTHRRLLTMRNH